MGRLMRIYVVVPVVCPVSSLFASWRFWCLRRSDELTHVPCSVTLVASVSHASRATNALWHALFLRELLLGGRVCWSESDFSYATARVDGYVSRHTGNIGPALRYQ